MSYNNFVQRTTFLSLHRSISYEARPDLMQNLEQVAIALGAKPHPHSRENHHFFLIEGRNSEHIMQSIEMAWLAVKNYKPSNSSLIVISETKEPVIILPSSKNNIIIGSVYLMASIAGYTVTDAVVNVSPELYRIIKDFIQKQKEG